MFYYKMNKKFEKRVKKGLAYEIFAFFRSR